jgi:hypothetical protein
VSSPLSAPSSLSAVVSDGPAVAVPVDVAGVDSVGDGAVVVDAVDFDGAADVGLEVGFSLAESSEVGSRVVGLLGLGCSEVDSAPPDDVSGLPEPSAVDERVGSEDGSDGRSVRVTDRVGDGSSPDPSPPQPASMRTASRLTAAARSNVRNHRANLVCTSTVVLQHSSQGCRQERPTHSMSLARQPSG